MNDIKKLIQQHKKVAQNHIGEANAMISKLPDGPLKTLFRSAMNDVKSGAVTMDNIGAFANNLKTKANACSNNDSK